MIDYSKLAIIFKREYLTRVTSKAYILTTLLAPLGFLALIIIPIVVALLTPDTERTVAIIDQTENANIAERMIERQPDVYVSRPGLSVEEIRAEVAEGELEGYIVITEAMMEGDASPELIYGGSGGMGFINSVRNNLNTSIRDARLDRAEVSEDVRNIMQQRISLSTRVLTESGEEEQDSGALFIVGLVLGFIMYMSMFLYGGIVMRGVIEEKTSRIVEVIVSSVRPFELLLGKVLGVGALAVTQFVFWAGAFLGISALSTPLFLFFAGSAGSSDTEQAMQAAQAEMPFTIPDIGIGLILGFILFFVLGYLIYSALFAAVGSALESETEIQQLSLAVSLPIIIPIMFIGPISSEPDSMLAVVMSLIPMFSPILMPVRFAIMSVPVWQIGLSVALMIATFIGLMWVSARIYRVGILMYGKSASFKELLKWLRYS
ncbi:MAG: ABC transporter permease [Cyclonatronaceae bacterium]